MYYPPHEYGASQQGGATATSDIVWSSSRSSSFYTTSAYSAALRERTFVVRETANSDWGSEPQSFSSFYSTSAYVLQSARDVSGNVVVAAPTSANSMIAQATYADFVPQNVGMAQVNRYYEMADDIYEQYLSADAGQSKMYARGSRPNDGPTLGELTPVGDAVLPLLACVVVYAAFKIRRIINLKKAKSL